VSAGLRIEGAGLVTPAGHSLVDTHWAALTGLRRFRESPVLGLDGHPLKVSAVLPVSPASKGLPRRLALLRPALAEAIEAAGRAGAGRLRRAALVLCPGVEDDALVPREAVRRVLGDVARALGKELPEPAWPGGWTANELLDRVVEGLAQDHAIDVPPTHRAVVSGEDPTGIFGLAQAEALLEAPGVDGCLLVAVDTACEARRLGVLDAANRIQSARHRSGPIPGEAAAVLYLRRAAAPDAPGLYVAAWAQGVEPAEDVPAIAAAWTSAVEAVLAADEAAAASVALAFVDLNGDRRRAQAWSFTATRTLARRKLSAALCHPADTLGDVMAASGPVLLALAGRRLALEAPGGAAVVACCAALGRARAAALVRHRTGGG
jgi:3-oxoacyl-[acyl-carrier-protein] synthase I